MMNIYTHMPFIAALAGKPGCYRFWEQLGQKGVCMSSESKK
jgi:hypothetical protein